MRGYIPFGQESGLQTHFEPKEGFSYGFSWPQGSEGQMSNALHGDNVWPADYHGRHVLENLFTNEIRFAEKLTECISMALNKGNRSALSSYVDPEGSTSVMRLFHYFSASEFKESTELFGKTVMGSSPHTDWGYLTLILQDDVGGLQLRHNDAWIDVPYVANSLVVNGGDFLHVLSGGLYRSPVHRVLSPVTRGRTSFVLFYYPRFETPMDAALFTRAGGINAAVEIDGHNSLFKLAQPATDNECNTSNSFGEYIIEKWKEVKAY